MSIGRYTAGYALLKEILTDTELNAFVREQTGKALTVIDSGPKVTLPAAGILFEGAENSGNAIKTAVYSVIFVLPLFGTDGMKICHEFLDVATKAFMRRRSEVQDVPLVLNPSQVASVVDFRPISIVENNGEKHNWAIETAVTIVI